MLQNLGNLASISEMGSHGVFNLQAAEAFGKLGFIADIGGVALDGIDLLNYYKNGQGNMDGIRFSIR